MTHGDAFSILVDSSAAGQRLDVFVGARLPDCSRSFAAQLIAGGNVRVNDRPQKPGHRLKTGDAVTGCIPPPRPAGFLPEPIPLAILYEDEHIVVINKPPGLVVHPAPGHYSGTLVNGLLYHCPDLGGIGSELRPGIVHRLDKDTSGTLVVAKDGAALEGLNAQFKARTVQKTYLALVHGAMPAAARDHPAAHRAAPRGPQAHVGCEPQDAAGRDRLAGAQPFSRFYPPGTRSQDRPHPPDPRALRGRPPPHRRRPGLRQAQRLPLLGRLIAHQLKSMNF